LSKQELKRLKEALSEFPLYSLLKETTDIVLGNVLVIASAVIVALFMTVRGHLIPRFGSSPPNP
jgi:hypothetical protein